MDKDKKLSEKLVKKLKTAVLLIRCVGVEPYQTQCNSLPQSASISSIS